MQKINNDIYWTGYIDWDLRNFHGYTTPSGSTYNSYLILDEKPTLIDAVKHYGFEESFHLIKNAIDPSKIKYIISNHTEMDHSGTIEKLLEHCPDAEVVCSPKGEEGLRRHFKRDWNFKVVNSGDELAIGKRKLTFQLMPMVHWPDSMATYSAHDKILFPNDAFGQHHASNERYADEVGLDIIMQEAAKYYANIVMPYGNQVLKALEAVKSLSVDMICPSHGLIWRNPSDINQILEAYKKWASYEPDHKAVIIYDTMWHSTEQMANKLYELLSDADIPVKMLNLQVVDNSEIITEVLSARFVLIGSPILNNRMLPTMANILMYMKGLKTKNKYGFTFGSYGWATVGFKELEEFVKEAGIELLCEGKYFKYIPDANELESLSEVVERIKKL